MSGRITLYKGDVDEIVRYLNAMGEVVEPRTDYSGRGMYGATCLGFVVDQPHRFMLRLGRLLGSDSLDPGISEALEDFDVRTDDMGLSKIVYFPEVEVLDVDER